MIKGAKLKYWMALGVSILLALAASDAMAAGSIKQELDASFVEPARGHTMCAVFNAVVAVKQEGAIQQIIEQEAYRHYQLAVARLGSSDAAAVTEKLMMDVQEMYNTGRASWSTLTDIAHACTEY